MKIQPIINKLIDNWTQKVFCVIIAFLLYFFFNISSLSTKTFSVDVDIVSNGQMMAVSSYQKHVKVSIRANPEDLATISSKDISAQLNLNPYTKPGIYNVPVALDFASEVLLIDPFEVRVIPDTVSIQIEDKTFSYKDIQVSFADEVPHGYEVLSYSVEPSSLRVVGSRSAVEQTTKLYTNRLSLLNHNRSFSAPVTVSTLNSLISVENSGEVNVSVEIAPIMQSASFADVSILFAYLNSELEIVSGADKSVSFSASGEQVIVESLSKSSFTVQADCSELTEPGEYEIPLRFLSPAGIVISEKSAETVKITLQHKNVETEIIREE